MLLAMVTTGARSSPFSASFFFFFFLVQSPLFSLSFIFLSSSSLLNLPFLYFFARQFVDLKGWDAPEWGSVGFWKWGWGMLVL